MRSVAEAEYMEDRSTRSEVSIFDIIPESLDQVTRRILVRYARYVARRVRRLYMQERGQHFVVNPKILRVVCEELRNVAVERVFEIGTGHGILTLYASRHVRHIVTCEIDRRLAKLSYSLFTYKRADNVDLTVSDALVLDWSRYGAVVSNLPFNITSEALVKIVREGVPLAVFTVQAEVADRLVARPGSSTYGRLTVLIQCFYDVKKLGVFSQDSFYPAPEVRVAVVRLTARSKPLLERELLPLLEKVTAELFSYRNKVASRVLRELFKIDPVQVGIDPQKRIYQLTLEEIVRLVYFLSSRRQ